MHGVGHKLIRSAPRVARTRARFHLGGLYSLHRSEYQNRTEFFLSQKSYSWWNILEEQVSVELKLNKKVPDHLIDVQVAFKQVVLLIGLF